MTKTFLTAAVLAAATFATGAYAQSYDQGGSSMQGAQQQQYDSSSQSQWLQGSFSGKTISDKTIAMNAAVDELRDAVSSLT